jgi:hypothetical protein
MDAVLEDFDEGGRVKFEAEDWAAPSLQERRAIVHAAEQEIETLRALIDAMEHAPRRT